MGCFVPDPIAQSFAKAESNAQTITCMKVTYIKQIVMDIIFGHPLGRYTVLICWLHDGVSIPTAKDTV
jgi:hypothetical protein